MSFSLPAHFIFIVFTSLLVVTGPSTGDAVVSSWCWFSVLSTSSKYSFHRSFNSFASGNIFSFLFFIITHVLLISLSCFCNFVDHAPPLFGLNIYVPLFCCLVSCYWHCLLSLLFASQFGVYLSPPLSYPPSLRGLFHSGHRRVSFLSSVTLLVFPYFSDTVLPIGSFTLILYYLVVVAFCHVFL